MHPQIPPLMEDAGGQGGPLMKDAGGRGRLRSTVTATATAVERPRSTVTATATAVERPCSTSTATAAADPRRSFLHRQRIQNDHEADMDRGWMSFARSTTQYSDGVKRFIEFAVRNSGKNGKILCPCSNCGNRFRLGREEVHEHLIWTGFMSGYTSWVYHGYCLGAAENQEVENEESDEMEQLLVDGFGIYDNNCMDTDSDLEDQEGEGSADECDEDAETFRSVYMEGSQELYEGCKKFSKLQFLLRLLNITNKRRVSNVVIEDVLKLFRDALPEGHSLPKIFHELKKIIKVVGLGYDSHDACKNDCILFRGQHANANSCLVCKASRWKTVKTGVDGKRITKVAQKVIRHFPLKKRIRRLFMSSKTAPLMTWHNDGRTKDGLMRHPADSPAWKHFDLTHKKFSGEPRNIRFGLAADGFNINNVPQINETTKAEFNHVDIYKGHDILRQRPDLYAQIPPECGLKKKRKKTSGAAMNADDRKTNS